ncbi:hypothetical protein [Psychromicrobium lacuslunae]|uniref:Uncharacterized protein n=1 Tax=Psychromicrobium lacuslunae TaxID=1618207 RepID=A0A0D4BWJ1_9MICC|nr:hypothetical protein [Psychromicrobium lacuslunae]AJT40827.1 hypothetical protein UM93_03620 [Psychromicrobium lacuslunae]
MRETSRRISIAALATIAVIGLAASSAAPASANTYTWYKGDTTQNQVYSESSNTRNLLRGGVSVQLNGANGSGFFRTTLWLGSASSQGGASANLSGPRGINLAKFRWEYPAAPNANEHIGVTSILLDVPGGGGGMSLVAADTNDTNPNASKPSLIGQSEGTKFWEVTSAGGATTLTAESEDGFTSSSTASAAEFNQHGLTVRLDTPKTHAQAVLVPQGFVTQDRTLTSQGLTSKPNNLYVDLKAKSRAKTSVFDVLVTRTSQSKSSAPSTNDKLGSSKQIILFGTPVK